MARPQSVDTESAAVVPLAGRAISCNLPAQMSAQTAEAAELAEISNQEAREIVRQAAEALLAQLSHPAVLISSHLEAKRQKLLAMATDPTVRKIGTSIPRIGMA